MQELKPDSPPDEILGPFTDLVQQGGQIIGDNIPKDLQWEVLILSFVIATLIWLLRKGRRSKGANGSERKAGFLEFIVPKDIYTHLSARVDIGLYLTTRLFHAFWGLAILAIVGPWSENLMIGTLQAILRESPALPGRCCMDGFRSVRAVFF